MVASYLRKKMAKTGLVVNPIIVCNFAFLCNCTPVGPTSDSMMVPLKDLSIDEMVGA